MKTIKTNMFKTHYSFANKSSIISGPYQEYGT